jgi:hypothetical protein
MAEVENRLVLGADLQFSNQPEVEGTPKQKQIPGKRVLNLGRSLARHRGKWSGFGEEAPFAVRYSPFATGREEACGARDYLIAAARRVGRGPH